MAKIVDASGWFTAYSNRNVRYGPRLDFGLRYIMSAGKRVRFYAEAEALPDELWLCLDEPMAGECYCFEAVAAIWNKAKTGEIVYD